MRPSPPPRPSSPRARQRGAALLLALGSIAVLTAASVELAYNTRVSLQMAANARDGLRAEALAQSAVAMSRLVLHFQQRLDAVSGGLNLGAMAPALQAALGQSGAGAGLASALSGSLSLRLWDLVPIDSSAVSLFLGGDRGAADGAAGLHAPSTPAPFFTPSPSPGPAGDAAAEAAGPEGARRAFGEFDGSFHATIEDEERKINIRQFDGTSTLPAAQTARLAELVRDPRWDFLFDQDDANGFRVSRRDLFAALLDWQDENEVSAAFTGAPGKPFEQGFGDENYLYDRLTDRYHAKNAPYDSLDELYLVGGVTDAFMAAFGDKLTVYPDVNAPINVNTDDPQQLLVNTLMMSDPPGVPQPAIADPAFLTKLQAALALARPLPFMSMTPQQFAGALQSLGVKVGSVYLQAQNVDRRNPFGTLSKTFHIHAVGVAGEVKKTIDAVVTFDSRADALKDDQGRLLHWHEE